MTDNDGGVEFGRTTVVDRKTDILEEGLVL